MTRPRHRGVSHTRDLWADALGRTATRALQGLVLLTAAAVVVYGLIQLELVVIPLMIFLILAAALHPVVAVLRRRGVPGAPATWIAVLAAIMVLGGIVTGIVFAVRSEWDELVAATVAGLERLREFVVAGPVPVGQQALDEAITGVVEFTTSSRFGAGALLGISAAAEVITGAVLAVPVVAVGWAVIQIWFPAPDGTAAPSGPGGQLCHTGRQALDARGTPTASWRRNRVTGVRRPAGAHEPEGTPEPGP